MVLGRVIFHYLAYYESAKIIEMKLNCDRSMQEIEALCSKTSCHISRRRRVKVLNDSWLFNKSHTRAH